ncbi:MAG: HU family DNA-binding protein [Candidatus Schekmanbacteria bacterium]|nr:HU family DNA-binding protein [Candidatus Schekmanbacteria bacterium]
MNKTELVDQVASAAGLSKTQAGEAIEKTLDAIRDALAGGTRVTLVGFGTFDVRERASRTGVNPQTKDKMQIPAMKSVHFKPGKLLKEAVRS